MDLFLQADGAGAFGEEATDLNRLVNLDQITRSMGAKDLISFIGQVESAMGLLQTDLPDQVKIGLSSERYLRRFRGR